MPTTNGSPTSGEWPTVPPAPSPARPTVPVTPLEPPALAVVTKPQEAKADDEQPTMAIDTSGVSPVVPARPRLTRTRLRVDTSPVAALQESARRRVARTKIRAEIVWQPRFAIVSAVIILLALIVVTLPLWIVLFRITGQPATQPRDVMALCMILMGGFLTAAALWGILVEMRGRIRMVDTLARSGDQVLFAPPEPEQMLDPVPLSVIERGPSTDPIGFPAVQLPATTAPVPLPGAIPSHAHFAARAEAEQANAAQMLEASSKLLGSFSSVLKSFGQLPAQVATLVVALGLFVGATFLSLH